MTHIPVYIRQHCTSQLSFKYFFPLDLVMYLAEQLTPCQKLRCFKVSLAKYFSYDCVTLWTSFSLDLIVGVQIVLLLSW